MFESLPPQISAFREELTAVFVKAIDGLWTGLAQVGLFQLGGHASALEALYAKNGWADAMDQKRLRWAAHVKQSYRQKQ